MTGYPEIAEYARARGIEAVENDRPELGISESIRLGLNRMKDCGAVLFTVCDQPWLTGETFLRLVRAYAASDTELACMGQGSSLLGNPCVFGRRYYEELLSLTGDVGGKRVIMQHQKDVMIVQASDEELKDIDFKPVQPAIDC